MKRNQSRKQFNVPRDFEQVRIVCGSRRLNLADSNVNWKSQMLNLNHPQRQMVLTY